MAYSDFTNMSVWQKAYKLALFVYSITKTYPKEERYAIVDDMRRAALSISNNIAEGYGRFESRDKSRFYKISRGSAYEVLNQAILSKGLKYIDEGTFNELKLQIPQIIDELDLLIKTLETRDAKKK